MVWYGIMEAGLLDSSLLLGTGSEYGGSGVGGVGAWMNKCILECAWSLDGRFSSFLERY